MFRNLNAIEQYARLKEGEGKLLKAAQRPIVLLDKNTFSNDLEDISPGLGNVGMYFAIFRLSLCSVPLSKLGWYYNDLCKCLTPHFKGWQSLFESIHRKYISLSNIRIFGIEQGANDGAFR